MISPDPSVLPRADRPVLQTDRLLLRRPEEGDIDAIVAIAGDWEVARRLARMPYPYDPGHARTFLDTIVPNEMVWAMILRSSAELVGMIGLTPEADHGLVELGYYVAREHWGRGLATEAGWHIVDYARRGLALATLSSGYFVDNPSSGRVLEKLGFIAVGRSERSCLALGGLLPSVEMRLPLR